MPAPQFFGNYDVALGLEIILKTKLLYRVQIKFVTGILAVKCGNVKTDKLVFKGFPSLVQGNHLTDRNIFHLKRALNPMGIWFKLHIFKQNHSCILRVETYRSLPFIQIHGKVKRLQVILSPMLKPQPSPFVNNKLRSDAVAPAGIASAPAVFRSKFSHP